MSRCFDASQLGPLLLKPNIANSKGETPLIITSRYGCLDAVKALLEHGANINAQDKTGDTALAFAVENSHTEVVEELLNHGADINLRDISGVGVLEVAIENEDVEIVKLLLERGADPNYFNADGELLLTRAINSENIEMVRLLLEYEANPNFLDEEGYPALAIAIFKNNVEITRLLLENGANPNGRDVDRRLILHHAAGMGNQEIINLLTSHGAIVEDYLNEINFNFDSDSDDSDDFEIQSDFKTFLSSILYLNPKNTFGKNYSFLRPYHRSKFIKFIHDWSDYCADPHKELHPAYIKFIAQMLGLGIEGLSEEEMCSMIKDTLQEYLRRLEDLDYSQFKDTEPISREEFTEFRPIDLLQYGNPIEGKYRGLTTEYIDESLDKTHIVDPIDRSDLMNQRSNIINGNVYQDYLLRKMLPEDMLEESRVLVKPEQEMESEDEQVETLSDRLKRLEPSQLIAFINRLNPNRRQRLPTNLSREFYVSMLLRDADRFGEIPELRDLLES